VEHIAGVETYQVALATYRAASERWPGTPINAQSLMEHHGGLFDSITWRHAADTRLTRNRS
jgi:hypothetical protein